MEAIRVKDKEWQLAGVHYVRTEAMCNGFGVSLEMEFGEDKAGDEYILVLDGIHPVSTCRLHQLDENTGKIERGIPWTALWSSGDHGGRRLVCRTRCEKDLYQLQNRSSWIL